jgi:hypothetical protein
MRLMTILSVSLFGGDVPRQVGRHFDVAAQPVAGLPRMITLIALPRQPNGGWNLDFHPITALGAVITPYRQPSVIYGEGMPYEPKYIPKDGTLVTGLFFEKEWLPDGEWSEVGVTSRALPRRDPAFWETRPMQTLTFPEWAGAPA